MLEASFDQITEIARKHPISGVGFNCCDSVNSVSSGGLIVIFLLFSFSVTTTTHVMKMKIFWELIMRITAEPFLEVRLVRVREQLNIKCH